MAWYALYKWFIRFRKTQYTNWIEQYKQTLYEEWFSGLSDEDQKLEIERIRLNKERQKMETAIRLKKLMTMHSIISEMQGGIYGSR